MTISMRNARKPAASVLALLMIGLSGAAAQEACGLCDKEVVITADLASCFLDQYTEIAGSDKPVIVDLTECSSRGVVEALPAPNTATQEPDVTFMVSPEQLDCLKRKLEEPGLVLDPSAKIDLESCG